MTIFAGMIRMYRYSSGGEKFITIDGRDVCIPRFRKRETVHALCTMHGADGGILILDKSAEADFKAACYSPEGVKCHMKGYAAACLVAFADLLGVKPFHTKDYRIESEEGEIHSCEILSHIGESKRVRINDMDGSDFIGEAVCEGEFD